MGLSRISLGFRDASRRPELITDGAVDGFSRLSRSLQCSDTFLSHAALGEDTIWH